MGAAISGMHFTGMAAARFEMVAPVGPTTANGLSNDYLGVAIGATTALLLALALIATFMDRRFAQAQREARIVEASEARYRRIFDTAAVSIWDEDFSQVVAALDALRARGVRDFRRHFDEHPEFVAEAAGLVRVRDVNHATLELFEARDKVELLGSLDWVSCRRPWPCSATNCSPWPKARRPSRQLRRRRRSAAGASISFSAWCFRRKTRASAASW